MSESNHDARERPQTLDPAGALRVMVEELRAVEPPELPWDAMEQRLLGELARREASASARRASRGGSELPHAFTFAAVAAGVLLVGLSGGSGERWSAAAPARRAVEVASVALAPGEAGARGERDLLALRPGDVIEAADAPLTFSHQGAVVWSLAPGGRVVVREVGKGGVGGTLALERGEIRAEVTPRDPAEGLVEAFAVEVENTRVAVHGTAFSVTRDEGRVIVDVEHGSVAVGPMGHVGVTTGHLLVGPRRASFSLDGGRTARLLPRLADKAPLPGVGAVLAQASSPGGGALPAAAPPPVALAAPPRAHDEPAESAAAPVAAREARAPGPARAPVAPAAPPAPPEAAAAPPPATLTAASVRARLAQCFEEVYAGGSASVEVSISSTLHIVLQSDGSVQSARFDPPLKPAFQACAGSAIAGRFAESPGKIDIPITVKR